MIQDPIPHVECECLECENAREAAQSHGLIIPRIDWVQIRLNGEGCFHIQNGECCGRAKDWDGHGLFHTFVPYKAHIIWLQHQAQRLADRLDGLEARLTPEVEAMLNELDRQVLKWGGPAHDDQHSPNDWHALIRDYNGWARTMAGMGSLEKAGLRWIQVAALAICAASTSRRHRTGEAHR